MRGTRVRAAGLMLMLVASGCSSSGYGVRRPRSVAVAEPGLEVGPGTVVEGGLGPKSGTIAAVPPDRQATFVDRHPLFSKPRDYYESSGDNRIVKAAAATFVGIPVGLFGEARQIVVGTPVPTAPY
jgi:hypothetical protein